MDSTGGTTTRCAAKKPTEAWDCFTTVSILPKSASHNTEQAGFRREGPKIICLTGDTQVSSNEKIDLKKYCTDNYGPSAIVSRRLTDNRPLCTVKGDGGLSQTHHIIDVGQLCGPGSDPGGGSIENDLLDCAAAKASTAKSRAEGAEGPGRGKPGAGDEEPVKNADQEAKDTADEPGNEPELPDGAVVAISDNPDLAGCGIDPGIAAVDLLDFPDLQYPEPANQAWLTGEQEMPCPALENGFVPEMDTYCKQTGYGPKAYVLPDGRPTCLFPDEIPPPAHRTLPRINVSYICSDLYPGGPDKLRRSGARTPLIPVTKYQGGKIECFYLSTEAEKKWVM